MINKYNGHIEIPQYNTILAKGMTVAELEQTPFCQKCFKGWVGYTAHPFAHFEKIEYKKYSVRVAPRFSEGRLSHIDLITLADDDPIDWNDWSEDKMMIIYQRNNAFLEDELGCKGTIASTPYPLYEYMFVWGAIYSTFDIRSGGSSIGINYK